MSHRHKRSPLAYVAQVAILFGILGLLSLIFIGGDLKPTPALFVKELPPPTPEENPFSLVSLHDRLPPQAIERVQKFVNYYGRVKKRGFEGSLARSTRYIRSFKETFRKAGLPEELAYLPLIESGFDHGAVSQAQAVGVWQFMGATGRRFNLEKSELYDERRDPFRAAEAAAKYFKYLHNEFGNWELALAAYNAGEGSVRRAQKANRKAGLPTDYWSLDLPDETKGYVPAFLGAVIIAKNPKAFDFNRIPFHPHMEWDLVKVQPGSSLALLAQKMGISLNDLLELNPELLAGVVPHKGKHYLLKIPTGMRATLPELLGANKVRSDWMLYPVDQSATVEEVAARFHKRPDSLKKVNQVGAGQALEPGRILIIPL